MEQLIKVSAQTFWQITGKTITSLSTLFILGFISRRFGSEEVGLLTLALSYLGFFSLIVDLGLNGYLLPKFLDQDYEKTWRKLFGLRISLSALSIALAYVFILFWPSPQGFKQLVLIGAFLAILEQAVFTSATVILQSKLRYDLAITATSLGYAVILALAFLVNYLELPLPYFMLSYVLGWFLIMVVSLVLTLKYIKNIRPLFDFAFAKNIFKYSWPISATLILNLIYFRLDSFLISYFRNFSEVGIYNLAYQIFQSALVLPTFIMNGYYPLMVKNLKEDKLQFLNNLKKASLMMFFVGILGTVATFFFADPLVSIITGGEVFSESVASLKILSIGFPLFFLSALFMWVLVTIKEYKVLVKIYTFGLVVNGILNLIFIPQFSYWAASGVTVFSEGVILLIQIIYLRRKLFRSHFKTPFVIPVKVGIDLKIQPSDKLIRFPHTRE